MRVGLGELAVILIGTTVPAVGMPVHGQTPDGGFSKYIMAAVERLGQERASLGYGNFRFTRDLAFGDNGTLPATGAPLTMCVAAQLEVLVEALNLYSGETGDYLAFHYVPKITWTRLRRHDLAGQIWVVDHQTSNGAADAFQNFGIGGRIAFDEMFPGTFINFSRVDGSKHAAIFLGFLNGQGDLVTDYSDAVSGFRYFSAQGKGQPDGGLGYRSAFFSDVACPKLPDGAKRDCGVVPPEEDNYMVGGFVSSPVSWDRSKAERELLKANQAVDPRNVVELVLNDDYCSGRTTDDAPP